LRTKELAAILTLIIVSSFVIFGFVQLIVVKGVGASPEASAEPLTPVGSAAITNANLSSSWGRGLLLLLTVKNTGTSNLVGLSSPLVSPNGGGFCYTWSWNPTPVTTYPIYRGESVKGYCLLEGPATYRQGIQVTVSATATFSDGSTSVLSAVVTAGP